MGADKNRQITPRSRFPRAPGLIIDPPHEEFGKTVRITPLTAPIAYMDKPTQAVTGFFSNPCGID
jgi:hypothetical protein